MTSYLLSLALVLADKDEAKYQFMFKKLDDSAEVKTDKDRTTFTVTSKSGIGGLVVTVAEGTWPRSVVVRLQYAKDRGFTNLEGFLLTTSRLSISGSLKQTGKMELYFLGPDGKQGDLAGSVKVTVVNKNGALEVTLPAFLLAGAKDARIEWIDAYRR